MRTVVLSRLKLQWTRYAVVFAVVLVCSGFMTAALGLSSTLNAGLTAEVSAQYKNADAVVTPAPGESPGVTVTERRLTEISGLAGVSSVWAQRSAFATPGAADGSSGGTPTPVSNLPADPSLLPVALLRGELPYRADQALLGRMLAERLHVAPGDSVALTPATVPGEGEKAPEPVRYEVSGITETGAAGAQPEVWTTESGLELLAPAPAAAEHTSGDIQLRLAGPVTDARLRDLDARIGAVLGSGTDGQPRLRVITPEQATAETLERLSAGSNILTTFLVAFAGLSVLVALLVVTNTLSVLTAQRGRELALLRCVGATSRQVHRSVLAEGLALGVAGSVAGVAVVWGLARVLDLAGLNGGLPLTVAPRDVVVGVVTGVLLTLLASLAPARRARGASPLEGLRGSRGADGVGPVRTTIGAVMLVAGAGLLTYGAVAHAPLAGIAGGLACFLGVVLTARVYLPPLVRVAGRALPGGLPSRLAALNAERHPGRTSTTATALLIGVLLVATVLTGQHVARVNLLDELDQHRPVDIAVTAPAGPLSPEQIREIEDLPGVLGVQTTDPATADGAVAQVDAAQSLNTDAATRLLERVAQIVHVAPEQLGGALLEKASYVSLLEVMLTVTLGLLGAAVVVSVLGIASTMSLSVLERVRENSLLRALGLTRRQLGAMIRREALVISLVATAVGLVIGWAFGTLGVMSLASEDFTVRPAVPWSGLLAVVVAAVVVAVLASAAPVRRATRVTPVEGMARVD